MGSWQKVSGLSPGTERSLSRMCWSLPKKDSDFDAAKDERNSDTKVKVNFMIDPMDIFINDRGLQSRWFVR